MSDATVLIVDDDPHVRESLADILQHDGYATREVRDGKTALDALEAEPTDLVLLDLQLPRVSGMDVLHETVAAHPEVPVVIVSGKGTIQTAVEATKIGAYDFLEKPVDAQRALLTVRNALDKARLQRERDRLLEESRDRYEMVGSSDAMHRVYDRIDRAARTSSKVLITGESGTGKELVARAIHHHSDRAGGPFVPLNCAAFPESLIESKLFGHEKGAFTGANTAHKGSFEQADGGTLFLDEVGDMPLQAQAKTLRALEHGEIRRLGSEQPTAVDVRLIAATNADLEEAVEDGRFREDLYYRLAVITIEMPPLRERRTDVPALAEHFLDQLSEENGLSSRSLSRPALVELVNHDWPGNVRELRNTLERLVVLSDDEEIGVRAVREELSRQGQADEEAPTDLRTARQQFERTLILRTLRAHDGAIQAAAEDLGINRSSLYRKMQDYGIEHGQ